MGFKNCYFKIKSAIAPLRRATGARCSLRGNKFLLTAALGISALSLIVVLGCPATGGGDTSAPSTPAAPTLTAGNAQISVSWSAPSNTGGSVITGYIVHYRAGTSGSWTSWSHSGTGTSTTITSLMNGTVYQVRVRAINSNGSGAWSSTASTRPGLRMTISNVVAFGSGEGNVTGARNVSDAISGAPSNATFTIREVVRKRNNSTISSHNFFVGSDRRIKVGNRSATSDAFTPPAVDGSVDVYTLTVGCSVCRDATVDVPVERRIAFFNIGRHRGNFGYAACYNWLNTASTLATDISNDGFAAATARFFGSQGANATLGSVTIGGYTLRDIATHSNALNLSGNATARLLQTYVLSSNTVSKVTVIDGNTHTIGQIADINSGGGFQHNTGGPISRASEGGSLTNHFWSHTRNNGTSASGLRCANATSNSSSDQGGVGNRTAADSVTGGTFTNSPCSSQNWVLCVAK